MFFGSRVQWHRNELKSVWGQHVRHDRNAAKNVCRAPATFFGSTGTLSRFGERFRDRRYSFVSFLFAVLLLTVRRVPSNM